MDITDGGKTLKIDDERKALVDARSDFQRASDAGNAYSWTIETYDFTAADTILAVRNDNSAKKLHIEKIKLQSNAGSSEIEIHTPTASYTSAGTTVTGVCLNRSINKTAEATGHATETGNTQGTVVERFELFGDTPVTIEFGGTYVLGYDQAACVDCVTGGDTVYCTIIGYFK